MMPAMRPSTDLLATLLAALLALATGTVSARDYTAGGVRVGDPFATASVPGAPNGAAYLATLENTGATADRLLRASTPAAARVELHTMAMDGGTMRMREVVAIAVSPRETVKMGPGQGFHLMLMKLKAPLRAGDSFPLTLEFEKGGKVEVRVEVQPPRERAVEHRH